MIVHSVSPRICPSPGFNSIFQDRLPFHVCFVCDDLNLHPSNREFWIFIWTRRRWNILPVCWLCVHSFLLYRVLSIDDVNDFVCFSYVPHFLSNQLLDIDFEVVISLHQSYVFKLNNLPFLLLIPFSVQIVIILYVGSVGCWRWVLMSMSADSYFWICNLFVSNCIVCLLLLFCFCSWYIVRCLKNEVISSSP